MLICRVQGGICFTSSGEKSGKRIETKSRSHFKYSRQSFILCKSSPNGELLISPPLCNNITLFIKSSLSFSYLFPHFGRGAQKVKGCCGDVQTSLRPPSKKRSRKLFLSSMYLLGNRKHLVEGGGGQLSFCAKMNEN